MKIERQNKGFRYPPDDNKHGVIIVAQGQDPMGRLQFSIQNVLEARGFVTTTMGSELNVLWANEIVPSWVQALNARSVVLVIGYQTSEAVDATRLLLEMKSTCSARIIMLDLAHTASPIAWGIADFASDSIDEIVEYMQGR